MSYRDSITRAALAVALVVPALGAHAMQDPQAYGRTGGPTMSWSGATQQLEAEADGSTRAITWEGRAGRPATLPSGNPAAESMSAPADGPVQPNIIGRQGRMLPMDASGS